MSRCKMPFDLGERTKPEILKAPDQRGVYAPAQPCSGVKIVTVRVFGGGAAAASPEIIRMPCA